MLREKKKYFRSRKENMKENFSGQNNIERKLLT